MSILTPKGKKPPEDLITPPGEEPEIPSTLPILPLKGSVLFPYTIFPVSTDEPKAIQAIEEAARSDKMLGLVALKDEEAEVSLENLYSIGTAGVIVKMLKIPQHGINLIIQGIAKIRLKDFLTQEPGLRRRRPKAMLCAWRPCKEVFFPNFTAWFPWCLIWARNSISWPQILKTPFNWRIWRRR